MNNTNLKLIVEDIDFKEYEIITEDVQGGKKEYYITGPYMKAEFDNLNGRRYEYENLKSEADRYIKEYVEKNRACGTLEHIDSVETPADKICHKILTLKESDNKTWVGKSVIVQGNGNAPGDMAICLMKYKIPFGMSTRGIGKVDESQGKRYVKPYKLLAVDLVSNPSTGEWVSGVLESKQFMIDNHGLIVEMAYNNLENSLKKLPKDNILKDAYISSLLKKFIKQI